MLYCKDYFLYKHTNGEGDNFILSMVDSVANGSKNPLEYTIKVREKYRINVNRTVKGFNVTSSSRLPIIDDEIILRQDLDVDSGKVYVCLTELVEKVRKTSANV